MLYQFDDDITSVDIDELKDNTLTVGFLNLQEAIKLYKRLNIPLKAVELCKSSVENSTTYFEAYDHCFFIRLGLIDDEFELSSKIGIVISKEQILIISIADNRSKNRDLFLKMMSREYGDAPSCERILLALLEGITAEDDTRLDKIQQSINILEDKVINNCADNSFNANLLELKGNMLMLRAYYERLIDISNSLIENEGELFDKEIKKLSHFIDKLKRLKETVNVLSDSVMHLWDAYQASIDMRLNETMKFFTLVTTIFFPLTVIVGWYGMNFNSMPELKWKYGYIYVIIFSVAIIVLLIFWFKRKKWI